LWPAISLVAVFLGVTLASLATRWTALTTAVTAIGRQTLPIYVMHMPILALLHAATVNAISGAGPAAQWTAAALEPAAMTAVVVAVCLALHKILPDPWLFDLPPRRTRPT
jgi:fucose 4-O-acetylase-like acetyltransferase